MKLVIPSAENIPFGDNITIITKNGEQIDGDYYGFSAVNNEVATLNLRVKRNGREYSVKVDTDFIQVLLTPFIPLKDLSQVDSFIGTED
jgi:hypothetical protein